MNFAIGFHENKSGVQEAGFSSFSKFTTLIQKLKNIHRWENFDRLIKLGSTKSKQLPSVAFSLLSRSIWVHNSNQNYQIIAKRVPNDFISYNLKNIYFFDFNLFHWITCKLNYLQKNEIIRRRNICWSFVTFKNIILIHRKFLKQSWWLKKNPKIYMSSPKYICFLPKIAQNLFFFIRNRMSKILTPYIFFS